MNTSLTPMEAAVYGIETRFNDVNLYKLNFKKEANFALQLLKGSEFLRSTAQNNPDSLQAAITNIAAIGISLNPAVKEAYLVPRGKAVCLDISYIGLIKLATDTGSIMWAQAEIVKKNDKFEFKGIGQMPVHQMDPFSDRGETVGVYCVAKLHTGEYLSTIMSIKEVEQIRDKSSAAAKTGPWKDFFEEMMKKTCIKRAAKLWPKSERVDTAIQVLNEHEGIDFNAFAKGAHIEIPPSDIVADEKTFSKLADLLKKVGRTEDQLLKYINTKFKTEMKSIEEFEPVHLDESFRAMGGK